MTYEERMKILEERKAQLEKYPLYQEVEKFQALQSKFANTGASDTEPNWIFANLMRKMMKGKVVRVPKTGDGWDLYTCQPKLKGPCNAAAKKLHAQVEKIMATPATMKEQAEVALWFDWIDED